jgi:putative DNA primase/helicase
MLNHTTLIQQACLSFLGTAPSESQTLSKIGQWLRFSLTGKRSDKSGALKVHAVDGGYVYVIRNHRTGQTIKGNTVERTQAHDPKTWRALRQQYETKQRALALQAQIQQDRKRRMLSAMVKPFWAGCAKPDEWTRPHPYLSKKQVPALNVRRYISHKRDVLVLPMVNLLSGQLESLYLIYPKGFKRPLKGTQFKGLCMAIGRDLVTAPVLWLVEGYATGLSLHISTGEPVIVAFAASNLEAVAGAVVKRYPTAKLKLCCDDDRQTAQKIGRNVGVDYGLKVQQRYPQLALYKPIFPVGCPDGLSDVNDLVNWQRQQQNDKGAV